MLDEFDRIVMQARGDIFGEETFFLVSSFVSSSLTSSCVDRLFDLSRSPVHLRTGHGLCTSKRLGTWLQDVFLVAIELKEELASAHRSLVVMDQCLEMVNSTDNDIRWARNVAPFLSTRKLTSRTGDLAFSSISLLSCAYENELPLQIRRHPSPSTNTAPKLWMRETIACRKTVDVAVLLAKTWRDLFLVALSVGNEAVALEAIKYVKEKEEFIMLIREEDEVGESVASSAIDATVQRNEADSESPPPTAQANSTEKVKPMMMVGTLPK